jgi:GTP cyclohydrolase II
VLREFGIEPMAEPKLLGITEIERLVKEKGLKVSTLLGKAIEVVASKPVLVSEEDKRPEYVPAAHDFAEELAQ